MVSQLSWLPASAFLLASTALASETITGTIYCDNYFEFWFNGIKIAEDPLDFTPHNAVSVSFTYDIWLLLGGLCYD